MVGLADEQTHTLEWDSGTMNGQGSWRVYGNWLIHEGASDPTSIAWGAIGCIEVCGVGGWTRFNDSIKNLSGSTDLEAIGNSGKLIAKYEAAIRPPLIQQTNTRRGN